jgi:gliding motility-associated-like protein
MKKLLLFVFIFLNYYCFAQFSKTHYIPPLSNSSVINPLGQFLYISCPSLTPVNFTVKSLGGSIISGTVTRDTPYVLKIGEGSDTQIMVDATSAGQVLNNKGYIVEANDLVYVTVRLTAVQNFHAGGLVSKGLAALGTQFRIGGFTNTQLAFPIGPSHYTFASILATENNTTVSFGDIKPGVKVLNKEALGNAIPNVVLNRGESYTIAVQGPHFDNADGLIGASITSNKPIAVNCGSFAGTNGNLNNLDLGTDQIVSVERTGREYIFIRGNGENIVERPLIVANENNTDVFLNGNTVPVTTLAAGQYLSLDGSSFSANGNLYVSTSKNVFAYQGIGGIINQANQNMVFVPPLNCQTPKVINNIPFIDKVDNNGSSFTGTVAIITEAGATLSFIINGIPYNLTTLPGNIIKKGPFTVDGNIEYVTYTFEGLVGNISVFSTKQLYLSYFGSSGNATYGGFYSGFTFKPEIAFAKVSASASDCIPSVKLSINSLTAFDEFQWRLNDVDITGATGNEYIPSEAGFYNVIAKISACGTVISSDKIPVSACPTDIDNDFVNDNIDIDNDNDGITNCTESFGNTTVNLSNPNTGTIAIGTYVNPFTISTTSSGPLPANNFVGTATGSFVSQTNTNKGNAVTKKFNFTKPVSLTLEYVTIAPATDWLSSSGEFILQVPVDKTITVLNPTDQLLIDTNYDGIYESGVTSFSSFQIRFRLNNGGLPLAAGTGKFKFQTYLTNSLSYTHTNLLETGSSSKASFTLIATCVPKDTDGDTIPDQLDIDSDNDGIPDLTEALGSSAATLFTDTNKNGLNDSYEPDGLSYDIDYDGVEDYLDLDSDNDGIYDLTESGSNAVDANNDGIIDSVPGSFGANGLFNAIETTIDSGILNYTVANTDSDSFKNHIDRDSDGDACFDVIEAGFADPDNDAILGTSPVTINARGIVTSASGYTLPNSSYIISAPITITKQPGNITSCVNQKAIFVVESNVVNSYQWQVSPDGVSYTNITDGALYSGAMTNTLQINSVSLAMTNYKYRAILNKNGNTCGRTSAPGTISLYNSPVVTPVTTLVQCDDDLDGITNFNLKQKESFISANAVNETFTYYSSLNAANSADSGFQITNPESYNNFKGNTIWVRVQNTNGCFSITQMNLIVSATQIPAGTSWNFSVCDDFINETNGDTDGISVFNFHTVTAAITAILPSGTAFVVSYYKNETDAQLETNALDATFPPDPSNPLSIYNYRNIGSPNTQKIWVRVDSSVDNSCFGLSDYVTLSVVPLPDIEKTGASIVCAGTPNQTIEIDAGLISGSPNDYNYIWTRNGQPLAGETQYTLNTDQDGVYTSLITNKITGCSRTRTINVAYSEKAVFGDIIVEDLNPNNSITVNVTGRGNYEFSITSASGPFQDSNFFGNLNSGIYTVYIRDKNKCGIVTKEVAVIGAPKFFTPNGDGINDYWKISGSTNTFFTNSKVNIFDRYGKLIYQIKSGAENGWDGTFNSKPLPADDYWYTLYLQDGRTAKGHFALKR